MTGSWESFGPYSTEVPRTPLPDERRPGLGVPLTLRPVADELAVQRPVFEPALKHLRNAYRAGDPQYADPAVERAWHTARRAAMELVLTALAGTPWAAHLVLRGSVALAAWIGAEAREPGDLDFVVVPESWAMPEPRTARMLTEIALAAEELSLGGEIRISAAEAVSEEIWTYDRVPGCRLVLPWTAPGTAGGTVQLDFVFNEYLHTDPEPTTVAEGVTLNAATPELSLAWKLCWLLTDLHAQGKDLYDAVLLAERYPLRPEVFHAAYLEADLRAATLPYGLDGLEQLAAEVEWDHFAAEYPSVTGDAQEYVLRLMVALEPTFRGPVGSSAQGSEYERKARLVAPLVARYRALLEQAGLPAVLAALARAEAPLLPAVVVVRELLGRERHGPREVLALLLEHPSWVGWARHYEQRQAALEHSIAGLCE
ncbi:nucleotidyl transferase AbiEii/AbiGii toxin family protein [Kitasatospora sp. McL0602]|uniref:nucleotidyl transferase AbiEii/AbiGii toxin family protein n=1 Tax=Kitasatospora sp. McL0602 TaxID=3439530 RepID=UPI003F8B17D3